MHGSGWASTTLYARIADDPNLIANPSIYRYVHAMSLSALRVGALRNTAKPSTQHVATL